MKNGDYVTGVPNSPELKKDHPTVTGKLSLVSFEFAGKTFNTTHIVVKTKGGNTADVDVDYDSLKEASPRRTPETVL